MTIAIYTHDKAMYTHDDSDTHIAIYTHTHDNSDVHMTTAIHK